MRLTVYAEQRTGEYFIGQLLDSHDEAIELDTCLAVVAREQVEGPFGEHIWVGPHHLADLLHRALAAHEGPLEKVLRTDRYTGEHYLDLTRPS